MNTRLRRHRFLIAILFCTVVGLTIRLALIVASGWRIDYDEAMVGLTALRVMRGQHAAFLPAQVSLGAGEAYLLAPLFTVFGVNTVVFRLYSLACAGLLIITTGLVGRCAFGARTGAMAALMAAVAPPYALVITLKTWGATVETMILGHLVFLAIYGAISTKTVQQRRVWMLGAGAAAGLSFWMAWLGLYYVIAAGLVMLWFGRKILRDPWALGMGLAAFFIASLPFWTHNAAHDWPTFAQIINDRRMTGAEIQAVLSHFVRVLLPQLVTGDRHWGTVGQFWTGLLLAGYGIGVLALWRWTIYGRPNSKAKRGNEPMRWMLALLVVVIPAVYIFSTQSRNALNPFGIDATGRYVVMLHSVLPIGLASLLSMGGVSLRWRTRWRTGRRTLWRSVEGQTTVPFSASLIGLILALNLAGFAQVNAYKAFDSPYYDRLPASLDLLVEILDEEDVRYVWTDAGLGQVLMFETQERILAADWYDTYIAKGPVRFPDVLVAVENAPYAAYLVPIAPQQADSDIPLLRAFDEAEIAYRTYPIEPGLLLILPDEKVSPEAVAEGLGYQY